MKTILISLISLTGGIFLAVQAGFNSQLGSLLKNPIVAVAATSFFSLLLTLAYLGLNNRTLPNWDQLNTIPWYLWGVGALFSVAGISIYFYAIPKIGISSMITLGLCGQLLFAIVAGHFGWLNLPREPFNLIRAVGTICLLAGIILINQK